MELLKTPLYEAHVRLGGKMVPFAGYLLPVQYGAGIVAEHMAVRTACGLFDVSHMGEIDCSGPDALRCLNLLLTNDFSGMYAGQARYSPMCNENGGVVDDLIVYKKADDHYYIVVNAANKDKDFAWMQAHQTGNVALKDISAGVAQLALQGPKAEDVLRRLAKPEDIPAKYYSCLFGREVGGVRCVVSRTGYTGENGFEFYTAAGDAEKLWNLLLETGKDDGLIPCGLGARDTLRLEAAMPLYGHEMDDTVTPLEAGLGYFVKMGKDDFIGKRALEEKGAPKRKRAGLRVTGRGIVREGEPVFLNGREIGCTTSGTFCPFLGFPAAMALLDAAACEPGTAVEAEARGRRVAAEIVKLPFYQRKR